MNDTRLTNRCRSEFEKWAIENNRFTIPYDKRVFFEFDWVIWKASWQKATGQDYE